jgi:hypothetical protein
MPLRISDVFRNNIITVPELRSDGYGPNSIYLSTVVATTFITQTITVSLPADDVSLLYMGDYQVNPGDIVYLYGTSPANVADGYYTVNSVINDNTISVNEPLANSTDGYIQFRYVAGALSVGYSTARYTPVYITHDNVQEALQDLDKARVQSGYITKQVEVDFGTSPTNYMTFTIYDTDVSPNSLLFPTQAGNAPTGKSADENEMDPMIFSATPNAGQFTLIASTKDGPVVGNFKVNYGIG